jgi:hypothetical protein
MNEVMTHMGKYGGKYQDWYVGVTADAKVSLFKEHGVKESDDAWICRKCADDVSARQIERYFMKKGCKGGFVDEEKSTRFFYAYRMQPHTRQ